MYLKKNLENKVIQILKFCEITTLTLISTILQWCMNKVYVWHGQIANKSTTFYKSSLQPPI
jgi:hypothetical protein